MGEFMGKDFIVVKDLYKHYECDNIRQQVLKNLNFSVAEGEFVSIMGPSGSGKSTLLYIIGGLENANMGTVLIDNINIQELKDSEISEFRRRNIGFVFQSFNLLKNITVEENISIPLLLDKGHKQISKDDITDIMKMLNIYDKAKARPNQLSGGEMQRVAIARALINKPKLILADEPTGSLDSKSSLEIIQLLKKINREFKTTIVLVTHSSDMADFSDKIYKIRDGTII